MTVFYNAAAGEDTVDVKHGLTASSSAKFLLLIDVNVDFSLTLTDYEYIPTQPTRLILVSFHGKV